MVRKKVKLELIENENARKASYKKRMSGVLKKTEELSVLCGVDACTIIYGPYQKSPAVWPSTEEEVKRIVMAYKCKPEIDLSQRRFNQESLLKQSVQKAEAQLMRLRRKNREMEMENILTDIINGRMTFEQVSPSDMGDLQYVLDEKLRTIRHQMMMRANQSANNQNN